MAWYDAIPIVGPLIGGLVDTASNHYLHKQDVERQQAWRDEDMEREDSSYQRTADDMRKAGLSPSTLTGGTDGGAIATSNPTWTPEQSMGNAFSQLGTNMISEKQFDEQSRQNWASIGIQSRDADTRAMAEKEVQRANQENEVLRQKELAQKEKEHAEAVHQYHQQVANDLLETGAIRPSTSSSGKSAGAGVVGASASINQSSSGLTPTQWAHLWSRHNNPTASSLLTKYFDDGFDVGQLYIDPQVGLIVEVNGTIKKGAKTGQPIKKYLSLGDGQALDFKANSWVPMSEWKNQNFDWYDW